MDSSLRLRACVKAGMTLLVLFGLQTPEAQVVRFGNAEAATTTRDEYCARFNPELAGALEQAIETERERLVAMDDADFASERGVRARQSYVNLLERYQDALTSKPTMCELFAALPGDNEFFATSIDVYFATDRATQVRDNKLIAFGNERSNSGFLVGKARAHLVEGGKCKEGPNGRPGFSTSQWPIRGTYGSPFVTNREVVAAPDLADQLRLVGQSAKPASTAEALVFVHGFNVSFDEAVTSAAEIVNCMRSKMVPFVVSWPSASSIRSYFEDEESVSASRERLRMALRSLLDGTHFHRVTIVAHSMGTRLVLRVLADLQLQGVPLKSLSRVVFVAPDIAEAEFLELWPRLVNLPQKGWTIYVARNDLALWVSTGAHRRPRVGDSSERVFVARPGDTVEASRVNKMWNAYGHSYLIESGQVVSDLRQLIVDGIPATGRGLTLRGTASTPHWELTR